MVMEEGGQRHQAWTGGRQLFVELGEQDFDAIRLSTYRTACKLRFIQKRCNLHLIDIYNVIEAIRDAGLNAIQPSAGLSTGRLENLVSSLFSQLAKRLPTTHPIDARESTALLLQFLLAAVDSDPGGCLLVLSVKAMLATLCGGKLVDKLRYVFSQVSDSNGVLVQSKFDAFLREALKLPTAVYEGPSFGYAQASTRPCFPQQIAVSVVMFLSLLSLTPPPPLFPCCQRVRFHQLLSLKCLFPQAGGTGGTGGRWGGRFSASLCSTSALCIPCDSRGGRQKVYNNRHQTEELSCWGNKSQNPDSPVQQALACGVTGRDRNPSRPIRNVSKNHVLIGARVLQKVNPGPLSSASGVLPVGLFRNQQRSLAAAQRVNEEHALIAAYVDRLQSTPGAVEDQHRQDEEHRLIARYTSRLADTDSSGVIPNRSINFDVNKQKRELIAQLEYRNREILAEIKRLRSEHEAACQASPGKGTSNPTLLAELRLLRDKGRMSGAEDVVLQESRRELMVQLEGLMKLLKAQAAGSSPAPPCRPSPSSVRPVGGASAHAHACPPQDSLAGVGGDVQEAFSQGSRRNLRNDLLVAADSITNTVSSLVKELHSGKPHTCL
uniref:Dystrobrevin, beta a n=1 Tax=Tetraodon nigroviridis TaxID=99883 RepID=H3DP81_TETNG